MQYARVQVRGYKKIVKFFGHEASDFHPTVDRLEKMDPSDTEVQSSRAHTRAHLHTHARARARAPDLLARPHYSHECFMLFPRLRHALAPRARATRSRMLW